MRIKERASKGNGFEAGAVYKDFDNEHFIALRDPNNDGQILCLYLDGQYANQLLDVYPEERFSVPSTGPVKVADSADVVVSW